MATPPIDLKSHFAQKISDLNDFCKENHLKITDTNGDGIFDINDKVEHIVQSGDSMYKIAGRYKDCSFSQLKQANIKQFPNADKIKKGDSIIIPLNDASKALSPAAANPQTTVKEKEYKFETHDFGDKKTRKVVDKEVFKSLKGKTAKELQKDKYYFDDKNGNGILDEGDNLYKQVSIMLDAGHDSRLRAGQKITIPGKGTYTTKENDSYESIAKAHGVSAEALRKANCQTARQKDPGAISSLEELSEAELNSLMRDELAKKLKTRGFDVIIAERTDKSHLKERQKEKLEKSPDIYISIHCNGNTEKTANGESVQYNPKKPRDMAFARIMNNNFAKDATISKNNGIVARKEGTNGVCVLNGDIQDRIAECLVEPAFITNSADNKKLNGTTSRGKIVDTMVRACLEQYNSAKVK